MKRFDESRQVALQANRVIVHTRISTTPASLRKLKWAVDFSRPHLHRHFARETDSPLRSDTFALRITTGEIATISLLSPFDRGCNAIERGTYAAVGEIHGVCAKFRKSGLCERDRQMEREGTSDSSRDSGYALADCIAIRRVIMIGFDG